MQKLIDGILSKQETCTTENVNNGIADCKSKNDGNGHTNSNTHSYSSCYSNCNINSSSHISCISNSNIDDNSNGNINGNRNANVSKKYSNFNLDLSTALTVSTEAIPFENQLDMASHTMTNCANHCHAMNTGNSYNQLQHVCLCRDLNVLSIDGFRKFSAKVASNPNCDSQLRLLIQEFVTKLSAIDIVEEPPTYQKRQATVTTHNSIHGPTGNGSMYNFGINNITNQHLMSTHSIDDGNGWTQNKSITIAKTASETARSWSVSGALGAIDEFQHE